MSPPSVDKNISTLVAFIPLPVVPATSHVTVLVVPASQVTLVFGEFRIKGPAEPFTVILVSSLLFVAPPARLSLAVSLKLSVLDTFGIASHCQAVAPVLIVERRGK